jgi:hypothetical protein
VLLKTLAIPVPRILLNAVNRTRSNGQEKEKKKLGAAIKSVIF